jgi:hypothetical protein
MEKCKVCSAESSFGQKVWSTFLIAVGFRSLSNGPLLFVIERDTGLILRSIELFIYIQKNVCVNVIAYAFKI